MTIHKSNVSRERFAVSLVKTALFAAALLMTSVATDAVAAGSISGRVTSSTTGLGLANTGIDFYELNSDNNGPSASTTTDASGNYTANLPAGSYGVVTQDTHGYINKIHNNISCSAVCDTDLLTPVVVTNSAVTGINFVLDPGGRITGQITSSATGLPIAGVRVFFVNTAPSAQIAFTTAVTDAAGNYISNGGTATGNIFAVTFNNLGYQDEVYNNIHCLNCDVEAVGTLIPVTLAAGAAGINFALDPGGRITGTVRDGAGNPVANVEVNIYDSTGNRVADGFPTDGSGNYSTAGFPAGNYFASTRNHLGLVDQLYNGFICANGNCNSTNGTAIPVTLGGTTSGINFVLPPGGTISGTVTNAAGGAPLSDGFVGFVTIGTSGPNLGLAIFEGSARTNSLGQYNIVLPPGTHFAWVQFVAGFANQLFNGLPCPTDICQAQNGTAINVIAGGTTGNINFALVAGPGTISGNVTNAVGGAAITGFPVQIFTSSGTQLGTIQTTGPSGTYQFTGLAPGSYYVRTNGNTGNFINQLYNGVVCVSCTVTASGGTLVPVTPNTTTSGIDFALAGGGRISGTITGGGGPLQGVAAQLFSSTGVAMGNYNTNASGVYTTFAMPPGSYFVRTAVTAAQNFIDQLWNSLQCVPCVITSGTPIPVVGTATTTGINFGLSGGGSISGTTTNAVGGAIVPSIPILVWDSTGLLVKTATTGGSGTYTVTGLPNGNYFVGTNQNSGQNFVRQVYNGFPFNGTVTTGTPVDVTVGGTHTGVDFAMSSGGTLTGTVTGVGAVPLVGVGITVHSPAGKVVRTATTSVTGFYAVPGLPAGTYYVSTGVPVTSPPFYVDELYDNLPCLGCVTAPFLPIVTLPCTSSCAPVTTGTPVVVTNGATRTGVNFSLATGAGVISGLVRDAVSNIGLPSVQVSIYNAAGVVVKSVVSAIANGGYSVRGLAPGTYYARTVVSPATPHYTDVAFGNVPCAPCNVVTTSTPIAVVANTTSAANFALPTGGSIAGLVNDSVTTNPLAFVDVQLFNAAGTLVKTTFSGSTGAFTLDGLPAGTYYARTAVPASLAHYVDELYDNIPCFSCVVTTGTAIVVANGATRAGVNFALAARPTIAPLTNVSTRINTPIAVAITVGSSAGAAGLAVTGSSSNTTLVPNGNLVFSGSGANRTLTIFPAANQKGATTITVSASDSTGTAITSFVLVVYKAGRASDFDGDGKADITVFRPSNGNWYIRQSSTLTMLALVWGGGADKPVPGDYDGDGIVDVAVFRPSTGEWFVRQSSTLTLVTLVWGGGTDIPVQADYDGDDKTDIAIFRPTTGEWFVRQTTTLTLVTLIWGGGSDIPVQADYDGDGKADIAIFRPSTGEWFIRQTSTLTLVTLVWGGGTDKPVPSDYDGDGKTDIAVFRPSTGEWFIRQTGTLTLVTLVWGGGTDIPVPGDFDGDGKADIAVFRSFTGEWFVRQSSTLTLVTLVWGGGSDIPILKRP